MARNPAAHAIIGYNLGRESQGENLWTYALFKLLADQHDLLLSIAADLSEVEGAETALGKIAAATDSQNPNVYAETGRRASQFDGTDVGRFVRRLLNARAGL